MSLNDYVVTTNHTIDVERSRTIRAENFEAARLIGKELWQEYPLTPEDRAETIIERSSITYTVTRSAEL